MRFCTYLVREGIISAEEGFQVLGALCDGTPPLGQLATRERMLSIRQLAQLLNLSAEDPVPLGTLAIREGFLRRHELTELLELQRRRTPRAQDALVQLGIMTATEVQAAFRRFLGASAPISAL
ncbi:MAG TPA: hypothetical protein ENK18_11005 [Deltaproteobacteria bacterium]|nr:hypothetical protein [Deltaproteobacteria bacterium]